ncbi:MAG: aminoacetone oxidase family FAD-binding enzyme [Clostridia bacterium]|nr:aminoacetone oxidase family FAD-binding enzyme [Clostridia bacterium]
MAAIEARKKNYDVEIIEKNNCIGKKLNITGKGRCNLTHSLDNQYFLNNVITNSKFLMSSINSFDNTNLIEFVNDLGVKTKIERGNRVFLASDEAKELTKAFEKLLKKMNVTIRYNSIVEGLELQNGKVIGLKLLDGSKIFAEKIVIATGGKSYPGTGSTGDGYELAKKVGHSVVEPKAALVPFIVEEKELCKNLEGLTLKNVNLTVKAERKVIDTRFGELVFTDKGISGPIVLSSSSIVNKLNNIDELFNDNKIIASIDLKPALDFNTLYKRLTRDFTKYINKDAKNALVDLLPKSIITPILTQANIVEDKKVNAITKQEKEEIVKTIKNFDLTVKALAPISVGIVTSGGINVKELNPKTMESKLVSGLYFAGEVIDVDAFTGGFNLQIAFSTGHSAGSNM